MIRRGTAARLGIRRPTWVTERDLVACDRSKLPVLLKRVRERSDSVSLGIDYLEALTREPRGFA